MGLPRPTSRENLLAGVSLLVDALDRLLNRLRPVEKLCSASLTLTTADQDVAGCTVDLDPGWYIVHGVFDFFHSLNGGGLAVGKLNVGGTLQGNQALLFNTGSPNGDRATVAQTWVFFIGARSTVKLQATKTINAGTAQAMQTHTTMTYQRLPT